MNEYIKMLLVVALFTLGPLLCGYLIGGNTYTPNPHVDEVAMADYFETEKLRDSE